MPDTGRKKLQWLEINKMISRLYFNLLDFYNASFELFKKKKIKIYAIPRGGEIVFGLLNFYADRNVKFFEWVSTPEECDIILDDVIESGDTFRKFHDKHKKPIFVMLDKRKEYQNIWVEFPWECGEKKTEMFRFARRLLQHFGNNKESVKKLIDEVESGKESGD